MHVGWNYFLNSLAKSVLDGLTENTAKGSNKSAVFMLLDVHE